MVFLGALRPGDPDLAFPCPLLGDTAEGRRECLRARLKKLDHKLRGMDLYTKILGFVVIGVVALALLNESDGTNARLQSSAPSSGLSAFMAP